jgi:tetratricopeptide (TPR) repeat protein
MPYLQHRGVGQHLAFARSDHSIPIPRPRFDQSLGIENACQKCHRDKDLAWQQSQVDAWYGTIKPHPRLVATLAATNEPATMREAATAYLLPTSEFRHPMVQAAGLSRFIQKHLRPDLPSIDAEVEKRLKAFTTDPDVDLQAMALMALQVGYGSTPSIQAFVKERLQTLKENDPVRRRWAICADHLGGIFGAKGDLAAATACFERGLEVEPRNEVILSHLALAYFRGGKPEAAVAALKKAIEVRPTKAVLHFQLAQVYAQLQRLPESIAALQSGLVHAPHDGNARAMLQQLQGL